MAVFTKTSSRTRSQEEVETKADPKNKTVVVPLPLLEAAQKWGTGQDKANSYLVQMIQLVIKEDFGREEVMQALLQAKKDLQESSARMYVSRIMRLKKYPKEVDQCLKGKMSYRKLEEMGKEERAKGDPEKKMDKQLKNLATVYIREISEELRDFIDKCKAAFKAAEGKIQKRKQQQQPNGQEEEEPEDVTDELDQEEEVEDEEELEEDED